MGCVCFLSTIRKEKKAMKKRNKWVREFFLVFVIVVLFPLADDEQSHAEGVELSKVVFYVH